MVQNDTRGEDAGLDARQAQSDQEFLEKCSIQRGTWQSQFALVVRRELASFARTHRASIRADTDIVRAGIIDPTDSLDLLDFALMLEGHMEGSLDPHELYRFLSTKWSGITVEEYIRAVLNAIATNCRRHCS